jgi:SAM-dependent methyltransferase
MSQTQARIQADFDRIALLAEEHGANHNDYYHGYLLRHAPARCTEALEIGCGTGGFARALARRAGHVLGIDLSPQMVRIARERSRQVPNIEYRTGDALQWDFAAERFDCIASIATLHHMPMEVVLLKMRDSLRPGGVILILDLYKAESASDLLAGAVAVPLNLALRLITTRRLTQPPEVRRAWEEHGRGDRYLTLSEVRRVCEAVLPGAKIRRHLLWRYSIVWRKPVS